ncbi:MAG: hypothetical protein M1820_007489 [Bogoriella megaspora]|nr:MAG: hypothetical protein M1820_007489 [Bogoriella megaspora]
MSLSDKYQQFLSSPSTGALSDKASLIYVPSLTTIAEPTAILKHLSTQAKLLTKKNESVLSAIESDNGLCLDVETTIEFLAGGGTYLPGLDDNFLTDRVVTFPMIHIVHFEPDHKIRQVRLHWDQGSLLKQLDVIGSRGKNWPIRDGKDQARLISSSASGFGQPVPTTSDDPNAVKITTRPKSNSNAMNDPHASLDLFQPRDVKSEGPDPNYESPNVARRMSAKPPQRDINELFGGAEEEVATPTPPVTSTAGNRTRSTSPSKRTAIPIKGGAGKHHVGNRLFEADDKAEFEQMFKSPERIKTIEKKYNHFEFGDGEEAPKTKEPARTKHQSQWDFEDFATPHKAAAKVLPGNTRHFGWSDDEGDTASSPPKRPVVHQPRRDAKPHFDFADDGTPAGQKAPPKTNAMNKGLGLYEDHIYATEEENGAQQKSGPLTQTTSNVNVGGRKKDFDAHWKMQDVETPTKENGATNGAAEQQKKKTLPSQMQSHWEMYDVSPDAGPKKGQGAAAPEADTGKENENVKREPRTKVKKQTERSWGFGDEENEEKPVPVGRKAAAATGGEKSFWDF